MRHGDKMNDHGKDGNLSKFRERDKHTTKKVLTSPI